MKYKTKDLKYAKLHMIKTNKYRSINIKIVMKNIISKEDITFRNVLGDMLIYSCKKYKTKKKLALKIQDLYSPYISVNNNRVGNYIITNFNLSMLNSKYTEKSMLDESINLLHEIIFNPNVKNNKFDSQSLSIIKYNIKNEINTLKDNPRTYANIKMFENMGKNEIYSYHLWGYLDDLEKINESTLYKYYKDFIKTNLVDIYVVGDFDFIEMEKIIIQKLNFQTLKKDKKDIYYNHKQVLKKPKTIIELSSFKQSKLSIGCKLLNLDDFERKYVINLYNMIFGGGFNSKLMQIIREKYSLAYYINSFINKGDNILIIQSGISHESFDKVINNIKKIMNQMQKGEITKEELENVKMEYLSVLEESYDSIDGILSIYSSNDLLKLDDYETKREMIQKVTIEDIQKLSKKVFLDTIYLLKGDNYEKK